MRPVLAPTMTVAELLNAYPAAAKAFATRGMACVGCPMAAFETLEEVAAAYIIDFDLLMEDITRLIGAPAEGARRLRKRKDTPGPDGYR